MVPFQTLALTGTGFLAGQSVRVSLDSITGTALLTPTVAAAGLFTGTLSAPQAISGTHALLAAGLPGGPGAYALLQVTLS